MANSKNKTGKSTASSSKSSGSSSGNASSSLNQTTRKIPSFTSSDKSERRDGPGGN